MNKKDDRLERVKRAIRRISNESNSAVLKTMSEIFYNKDFPGSPFTGDIYCHSWFHIDEQEVAMNKDDKRLQNLVRAKIELAIDSLIDLLEHDLKLLRKKND